MLSVALCLSQASMVELVRCSVVSSDDLYERVAKDVADAAGRAAFAKGLEVGVEVGREQGMAVGLIAGIKQGRAEGFLAAMQGVKSAISDGTRHGSPECARVLEAYKRLEAEIGADEAE
jgi:tetrahydromethanopterin S-methyltransferase subunit F